MQQLATLLKDVLAWPDDLPRKVLRNEHVAASTAACTRELGGLQYNTTDGRTTVVSGEHLQYGYAQQALRELRSHVSAWQPGDRANAPGLLSLRRGQEKSWPMLPI